MAKMRLKLEARPQPSEFWGYGSPLLALLVTVVIGVLLFALLGADPCVVFNCSFGNRSVASISSAS